MSWTILNKSVTGETQWFNASYGPALSTVADALVGSITQQTVGAAPDTYAGIVGTSSGLGNGAVFTIIVGGGGTVTNITVTTVGSSYAIGDTITIANGVIGGGGTDLIITLIADDFVTTVVPDTVSVLSANQNVAGYSAGTISFTIDPAPNAGAWTAGSTLEMTIIGGIDTSSFIVQTLVINEGDTNSTFYVDWAIPLQVVVLQINNNTTTSTGQTITVSAIRMQVETGGGGIGYVSSSGTTTGPGGVTPQIQFNDGGIFNGAAGALYDNTNTQIHLASGTAALPTLAFSDGTHPAGNYDTGIFLNTPDVLALSTSGLVRAAAMSTVVGGLAGFAVNTALSLARLSAIPANSWEDGNCGNSEFIVFTAADFMSFTSTTTRNATFVTYSGATPRSPVVYNNALPGPALACKLIPKGFIIDNGDGVNCFIYSDVVTGLSFPQEMEIDVRVQIAAGPTINAAINITSGVVVTIPAAAAGWQTAGNGSVNTTVINIPAFVGVPTTAAATGTGFNTINVLVTPDAAMNATNGGIVAFKVPIKRI